MPHADPEKFKIWRASYVARNGDKIRAWGRKAAAVPSTKAQKLVRGRSEKYKARVKERTHTEAFRIKRRLYVNERRKANIQFRLCCAIRGRFKRALKNNYKSGSAIDNLGCTVFELRKYLESLWQNGMDWNNYGRLDRERRTWHIDHVIPLSTFDLSDHEQMKKACHWTNLAPLWASENRCKSNNILEQKGDA